MSGEDGEGSEGKEPTLGDLGGVNFGNLAELLEALVDTQQEPSVRQEYPVHNSRFLPLANLDEKKARLLDLLAEERELLVEMSEDPGDTAKDAWLHLKQRLDMKMLFLLGASRAQGGAQRERAMLQTTVFANVKQEKEDGGKKGILSRMFGS